MAMKKGLYQHFRPDEYDFIEKIDDLARRVEETYAYALTDFLNLRQVDIAKSVIGNRRLHYFVSSDYYPAEYARLIVAPDYYEFNPEDFELTLLEVNYNSKFNQLTHSQIMGTLLHKLGIKRTVIGDILVESGYAQLLVKQNMADYFRANVTKIAKASVSLKEIPLEQLIAGEKDSRQLDIIVSSMRMDKVLATVLNLSRSQAVQLIETDKVKLDYQIVDRASEMLQVGDLISVRGFGRFSILSENGFTKNGKCKLTVDKMIHK
ncbi:YlmH family RNA-binding protein [Streptococcus macedonicus]|uniref:RNA-binding protein n=1 Tax=Streptococcus macedonicus TaxID=59310 RepID=A0A081JIY6_STRMC|nr:RNA-binding protein [Streptococcus macedonicus]KEH52799.1 RNA-binding protein [Streptococcus macedonicus]MCW8485298.1 RNA-binding protein [Streptococcus macedonicus]MCW8493520.1 RNA-binding protein [Streptococcus macedonicus]MCW8498773.1 RNA-binding protein [Streptococcus macedonicus]MCW8500955.1 RNA-binding protein [Streptococcus macedonicus]